MTLQARFNGSRGLTRAQCTMHIVLHMLPIPRTLVPVEVMLCLESEFFSQLEYDCVDVLNCLYLIRFQLTL